MQVIRRGRSDMNYKQSNKFLNNNSIGSGTDETIVKIHHF